MKSSDSNLDVSYVNLIVDRLKGIGKLKMKPGDDIKKFDQPNSVGYRLTESEFQSIINDKLKLTMMNMMDQQFHLVLTLQKIQNRYYN